MQKKAEFILAIDQGTTGTRAAIVSDTGNLIATSYKEISQKYPMEGWVEQNPEEILKSVLHTTHKVVQDMNISFSDIRSIGITNQRETTVLWDKSTGETFGNAIVWQCNRSQEICDSIIQTGVEDRIRKITGLPLDPYFSASKISWIIDNYPNTRESIRNETLMFGTMDTWLIWKLTNGKVHITDTTNASRTLLFDINTLDWSDELLDIFDVPKFILPEVVPSSGDLAITSPEYFDGNKIPINAIVGDQQASLFGQFCWSFGDVKVTYGTGAFILVNTSKINIPSKNGLITTIAWNINGSVEYALEGSIFSAGSAITWLRDKLNLIQTSSDMDLLADRVQDNGGVYFVPAFNGLGAPHWNPYARASLHGMTIENTKSHIVRAVLESIAFQTNDIIQMIESDLNTKILKIVADGGVSKSDILLQFQSDITDINVHRTETLESTALGAAYLAGLAVKFWESSEELKARKKTSEIFNPNISDANRNDLQVNWEKAISRSMDWTK